MKKCLALSCSIFLFALLVFTSAEAQDELRIVTWNIEHLGSPGRGFGGLGAGNLPKRTSEQLKEIARFIKDNLRADLVAVQEVAVTNVTDTQNESAALQVITEELGDDWHSVVASPRNTIINPEDVHNLQNAFVWNTRRVRLVRSFELIFANERVGQKRLFDRFPLIGYFQVLKDGNDTNDFLLINVHLTAGQDNDENHLAAMVIIQQNLKEELQTHGIREGDRIILGDFNDNPFAQDDQGNPRFSDLLYRYMSKKGYTDLVNANTGPTRMDINLNRIIDHVLVNRSAQAHLVEVSIMKFQPADSTNSGLTTWRRTFSDHFPLILRLKVENHDDDVD